MGYANPELKISYDYGLQDLSAADKTYTMKGPKGKTGRLRELMASIDTTFAGATAQGFINIGTAGVPTKYGQLSTGTAAAGTNLVASKDQPTGLKGVELPADTDFQVKFVASTGAGAAGKLYPKFVIDWF